MLCRHLSSALSVTECPVAALEGDERVDEALGGCVRSCGRFTGNQNFDMISGSVSGVPKPYGGTAGLGVGRCSPVYFECSSSSFLDEIHPQES